jgi:hypothetical protein
VLTGSLATLADAGSSPGSYAITQGSLTANPNYAMSFLGSLLTVMPNDRHVAGPRSAPHHVCELEHVAARHRDIHEPADRPGRGQCRHRPMTACRLKRFTYGRQCMLTLRARVA